MSIVISLIGACNFFYLVCNLLLLIISVFIWLLSYLKDRYPRVIPVLRSLQLIYVLFLYQYWIYIITGIFFPLFLLINRLSILFLYLYKSKSRVIVTLSILIFVLCNIFISVTPCISYIILFFIYIIVCFLVRKYIK